MVEIIVFVLFLLIVYGLYIYYNERSKKIMPSTETLHVTDEDIYQLEFSSKKKSTLFRKVLAIGLIWLGLSCVGLGMLGFGLSYIF